VTSIQLVNFKQFSNQLQSSVPVMSCYLHING